MHPSFANVNPVCFRLRSLCSYAPVSAQTVRVKTMALGTLPLLCFAIQLLIVLTISRVVRSTDFWLRRINLLNRLVGVSAYDLIILIFHYSPRFSFARNEKAGRSSVLLAVAQNYRVLREGRSEPFDSVDLRRTIRDIAPADAR